MLRRTGARWQADGRPPAFLLSVPRYSTPLLEISRRAYVSSTLTLVASKSCFLPRISYFFAWNRHVTPSISRYQTCRLASNNLLKIRVLMIWDAGETKNLPRAKTFGKTIPCCNWITTSAARRALRQWDTRVTGRMGARRRQDPAMRGAPKKSRLGASWEGTEIRSNDAQGYKVLTTTRFSPFVLCA